MLFRSALSILTDEQLVEQYRETGKKKLVGELYRRYSHLVLGVCMKYLKNSQAAEDATLDIFERLFSDLKTNKIDVFRSWVYVVSKNHCLMHLRKQNRASAKEVEVPDDRLASQSEHVYDTEKEEQLSALEQALSLLNPEQRRCVELFYLEKRSYKEIEDLTGFNLKTVKSHLQNGKRNLKIKIEQLHEFRH